jgi:hypothetical protein
MDLKLKLNTLRNELACTIDYFEKKQKKTKKRANTVKFTSVTFSALITVVLGLNSGDLIETFRMIAILLGSVVTIINAIDAFYNFGALWVKNTVTLARLRELKRELDFYAAGSESNDISQTKLDEYLNKMQQILKDDITQWLRIRQKVDSTEQNKQISNSENADPLNIDVNSFRNKKILNKETSSENNN